MLIDWKTQEAIVYTKDTNFLSPQRVPLTQLATTRRDLATTFANQKLALSAGICLSTGITLLDNFIDKVLGAKARGCLQGNAELSFIKSQVSIIITS